MVRKLCRSTPWWNRAAKADFIRLGVLGDWDNPYLTMNYRTEADIAHAGQNPPKRLSGGAKPVHWCIDCGSALAEAEVEYEDKTSPAIDVGFWWPTPPVWPPPLAWRRWMARRAVIWTTTPWTLPANQAVAVHPNPGLPAVGHPGGALILAAELAEGAPSATTCRRRPDLGQAKGAAWTCCLAASLPAAPGAGDSGEHVGADAGTGLVHTAPAHGLDDFQAGLKYQLAVDNPVGDDGALSPARRCLPA